LLHSGRWSAFSASTATHYEADGLDEIDEAKCAVQSTPIRIMAQPGSAATAWVTSSLKSLLIILPSFILRRRRC
jgi:hypothetical protein